MMTTLRTTFLMVVLALITGCASPAKTETSLYQDLGERSGIADMVEDLMYRIVEDERIAFQFKGIDVVQFHTNLTLIITDIPMVYCDYQRILA